MLLHTIPESAAFDPELFSIDSDELPSEDLVLALRYTTVASLTTFVWETLINIENDSNLLTEYRLRFPTVIFFISRFFCLWFSIVAALKQIIIIPNSICIRFERLVIILYCIVIVLTSLLFFLRVRAVFDGNPWVVAFFACSWLAVLGGSLTFIIAAMRIDTTKNSSATCLNKSFNPFITASTIIPTTNDTLVFLAITWRLFRNSYVPHTLRSGIRIVVLGDYLPRFSKVLLKNGQAYYLTIVTLNVIQLTMLLIPSNPNVLKLILSVPNIVLMNIMACRVFRNTILYGVGRESRTEISTMEIQEI